MANYAKRLPMDTTGQSRVDAAPPFKALATWNISNQSASSVISLNPITTDIEIGSSGAGTVGGGIVIRWIPLTETASVSPFASVIASGLTANFDHFIPVNWNRRLVVPRETTGQTAGGQIGSVNGLYQRIAWTTAGAPASILANEY